jgi:N-acetylmuramoyl-L-alanine amidase
MSVNKPEYIIVHHTGGTDANPLADTSEHTRDMVDAYHKSKGWEMIGYHWFIEKSGLRKAGRAENYHGAHTLGYNEKSIGICLAGNFDATLPTEEQINSLRLLLSDIRARYPIPIDKILPHRKFAVKTCYGNKLPDDWAQKLVSLTSPKVGILAKLEEVRKLVEATL